MVNKVANRGEPVLAGGGGFPGVDFPGTVRWQLMPEREIRFRSNNDQREQRISSRSALNAKVVRLLRTNVCKPLALILLDESQDCLPGCRGCLAQFSVEGR